MKALDYLCSDLAPKLMLQNNNNNNSKQGKQHVQKDTVNLQNFPNEIIEE